MTEDKNIRTIISEVSSELRDNLDLLDPITASKKLVMLASLKSSLNAYIARYDEVCRKKFYEILQSQEKRNVASAKVELEATDEAIELNAAKLQNDALKELIASLKYFVKANQDDYFNQKIQ